MKNAYTILLLEDEPIIALDVEDSLAEGGFGHVVTFRTCSAALDYLENFCPDAALVDVHLEDGICSAVVDRLVATGIPFIVYSGFEHALAEYGDGFGRGMWLSKPACPDAILAAMYKLLERKELVAPVGA